MNLLFVLLMVGSIAAKFISYDEAEDLFKTYGKLKLGVLTVKQTTTLAFLIRILRLPQYLTSQVLKFFSKQRLKLLCFGCRVLSAIFFDGIRRGISNRTLTDWLTFLCKTLRIWNHRVCKGVIEGYAPILIHVIKKTPAAKPRTLCGLALQRADDPYVCPYDDLRFNWQVVLPRSPFTPRKPPMTIYGKPLKVALITDVHVDPLYKPYSVANCAEPTCCRAGQTRAAKYSYIDESIYEKNIDIHCDGISLDSRMATEISKMRRLKTMKLKKGASAGYWGDYRSCDTPLWAFDDVIDRIAQAHKSVDVVYYIGDTVDHHIWATTYQQNQAMNSYVVNKMRRSFTKKVKVVPVIGNHESQPINVFAPESITWNNLNTTWLYKLLAEKWQPYLPKKDRATFLKRGEYSTVVRPGLRAIVLNNNVANKFNWWLLHNPQEPKKNLVWLVGELFKAEKAGEKVHILSHIPPGDEDLIHTWTREYNKIVNRFASTIAAEFNGHTHADEFKIFYNREGKAVSVAWNVGGATTYANFNPNYKIAEFQPVTFLPTNIENYIYNLTRANLTPNRRPTWYRLYDFRRSFRLTNLSPVSMNDLVTRMVRNKQLLDIYSAYFYKMSDARPWCNRDCQLEELCRTVVTVLWDRKKCHGLKKLYLKLYG